VYEQSVKVIEFWFSSMTFIYLTTRECRSDHSATGIGCGGDATAGSLSPPKRQRAVSRRPTAGTCFVEK